ncbi:MAG: NAD(P)-binding domain-containing protein, partial [Actinomycetota bacterium]|nr:NAD(P)-binding domain-containing protein [Actinomycetota bacterium]
MERKIAVLGAGKIGESLVSGLLSSGWRAPDEIVATARRDERLAELSERYGILTTRSNRDAVVRAGIVVIAVKPQDIEELLGELIGVVTPAQIVLSIAAAIPTAMIERHLGDAVPV